VLFESLQRPDDGNVADSENVLQIGNAHLNAVSVAPVNGFHIILGKFVGMLTANPAVSLRDRTYSRLGWHNSGE